ncbi:MAG: GNAT family N-acetyltransferase [Proteobacteria bacterium]|jgi:GNAT superfamily N-acetyltransferase|nr:GNAT family N-acetyltransferase [Pseudomonadota bacterium]
MNGHQGSGIDLALNIKQLYPEETQANLQLLAQLRRRMFRDFPYLQERSLESQEKHFASCLEAKDFVLIACFDRDRIVGYATGLPLFQESPEIQRPFLNLGWAVNEIFYFGESVLLPEFRGRGITHRFFDGRERAAKALPGIKMTCFGAVQRSGDHPLRPPQYRPLDEFWSQRGYRKVPELVAQISWTDIGESKETSKNLVFWVRRWGVGESDQRIIQ